MEVVDADAGTNHSGHFFCMVSINLTGWYIDRLGFDLRSAPANGIRFLHFYLCCALTDRVVSASLPHTHDAVEDDAGSDPLSPIQLMAQGSGLSRCGRRGDADAGGVTTSSPQRARAHHQ